MGGASGWKGGQVGGVGWLVDGVRVPLSTLHFAFQSHTFSHSADAVD